jgi:hypothetical protein
MQVERTIPQSEDLKAKLSTLWIFILFNMAFADIFSFMFPGALQQIMTGYAEGIQVTPGFLLIAAIGTEISIAMVFLSRLLQPRINRLVNIIAGGITILWVTAGGSNTPHYIFFASIEVACSLAIIWLAWKWYIPHPYPDRNVLEQTV